MIQLSLIHQMPQPMYILLHHQNLNFVSESIEINVEKSESISTESLFSNNATTFIDNSQTFLLPVNNGSQSMFNNGKFVDTTMLAVFKDTIKYPLLK